MANNENVWIVIPNWNGEDYITECLSSLSGQQIKQSQIIVVDNGSVDDSVAIIQSRFSDITLLKQPKNLGFAGGVNVGIRYAIKHGAEAVALFNNDAIAEKDWLNMLVAALSADTTVAIATGKLMRNDKMHIDSVGENYSTWGMPFPIGRNQKDLGQHEENREIFAATGGASLYRVKALEQVGLFDEKFFAYYEDVDISFRAQLAGWKVVYEPKAVAYHRISATSSRLGSFTRYHATKNFFLLYTKNMPVWLYFKYLPFFILQAIRLAISSTLKGGLLVYLKGFIKFVLLTPHIISQRHIVQSSREINIKNLDALLYKQRPPKIPDKE